MVFRVTIWRIAVDIAAYTLGGIFVERHFKQKTEPEGHRPDAALLEPTGMRKLVRDLHATHEALTFKSEDILEIEEVQRQKLKFRQSEESFK